MILPAERSYYEKYYNDLVGCQVIKFEWEETPDEWVGPFPSFIVRKNSTGEIFRVVLSQDPEGNGPGFLFGLAEPHSQSEAG